MKSWSSFRHRTVEGSEGIGAGSPFGDQTLDEDGDHDDHALGDLLGGGREVVQREDVVDGGEDEDAQYGADEGAAAAGEERAADDHGGDGVEFVQVAVGGGAAAGQHDQHEAGHTAAQPGQDVQQERVQPYVEAGEPGGLRVAADRERPAPERRAVQHDPAHRDDEREHDDQRRNPAEQERVLVAEVHQRLVVGVQRLGVTGRDVDRQAPRAGEHRDGHDERDDPAVRDDQAVDQAAADAHRESAEDHSAGAVQLGGLRRRPDRRERHDRAHRQVDPAADDDEGHADGDHAADRGQGEDDDGVVVGEELRRLGQRAGEDEDEEHAEQAEVAQLCEAEPPAAGALVGRRLDPGAFVGRRLAGPGGDRLLRLYPL